MRQIKKGSTNKSVDLYIIDSTDGTPETGVVWNTSGIDLKYRREGAAVVSVTEAILAALTTAHTDGGFLAIGNGSYRFDLPDAAFATGADKVTIFGTVTGMIVLPVEVQLVDFDPEDVVRLGLTALPNAAADAAGGLPISDAGGLDLDALNTAAVRLTAARAQIIDDWVNGGRLDLLLDAIPTTAMRGTDGALTDKAGFSLSTAGILAIWHQLTSAIVTAGTIGKHITDEITTARMAELDAGNLPSVTDGIQADLSNATDGLGALKALIDTVNTDLSNGTDGLGALKTLIDTVNTDLSNGTDGLGALKALIDIVDTVVDSILSLLDDARSEPGQGALPVNPDTVTKIDYLYKLLRNKKDNDGSTTQFYNDAGTVVDHKQTTSEAAGTVTKDEIITGP